MQGGGANEMIILPKCYHVELYVLLYMNLQMAEDEREDLVKNGATLNLIAEVVTL